MRVIAWTLAGCAATLIGLLGLLFPVIPGIVFLILAAFCFERASRGTHGPDPRISGRGHKPGNWVSAAALRVAQRLQLGFWLLARWLLQLLPATPNRRPDQRP